MKKVFSALNLAKPARLRNRFLSVTTHLFLLGNYGTKKCLLYVLPVPRYDRDTGGALP
ncbi:MAG: hypothetical protein ACOYJ5_09110 [Acutalibacteraceae bacterium]